VSREIYSSWVPEADQRPNSEQALLDLETDCTCRGAAADLFWHIESDLDRLQNLDGERNDYRQALQFLQEYPGNSAEETAEAIRILEERLNLSDDELRASIIEGLPTLLNRIHELVQEMQSSSRGLASRPEDEWVASAFVQLHLVTILLRAIRKKLWGSSDLVDDLVDIGERAFKLALPDEDEWLFWTESKFYGIKASLREQGVDVESSGGATAHGVPLPPEELRKQALWVVSAMFCNEAFKAKFNSGADEEALSCFAKACRLWQASWCGLSGELELTEAAECFERLQLTRSAVSSWKAVAESCNLICDSLATFSESEDLQADLEILDRQKRPWMALAYWQHAATCAEGKMTGTETTEYVDNVRTKRDLQRLKLDFLEEDLGLLERSSLKALIQAENTWYESPAMGGRHEGMVNELRLVFEHEVDATVFRDRQVRKSIDNILADREKKKKLYLNSRPGAKLSLQDMATFLELAGKEDALEGLAIRSYIKSLSLPDGDRDFLVSKLPEYLRKLAGARAKPEHRETVPLETMKSLRRTALGIGEPSYLRKLLNIKKAVRQKSTR